MSLLNELTPELKAHWTLHLNAANIDWSGSVSLTNQIRRYLRGQDELPNIKHPSFIHYWFKYPELREEIEAWDG